MEIIVGGFYLLSDQYYIDFPDPFLKQNKGEHRPFYYCLLDEKTGLLWMIPLSSREEKINLAQRKIQEGKSDIFHLVHLGGKPGVMLIADMCPVTPQYIKCSYDILGTPVVYKDKSEVEIICRKASKIRALLRRGVRFTNTPPDVFKIEKELVSRSK